MSSAGGAEQVWRWAAIFLAGVTVSMVAWWMIESRHYVTRDQVVQTVEQVMGRDEIMASLERIEAASSETRTRVRTLETSTSRLEALMERGR